MAAVVINRLFTEEEKAYLLGRVEKLRKKHRKSVIYVQWRRSKPTAKVMELHTTFPSGDLPTVESWVKAFFPDAHFLALVSQSATATSTRWSVWSSDFVPPKS